MHIHTFIHCLHAHTLRAVCESQQNVLVYAELEPRRQQFHVAPAKYTTKLVHHFGGYSKMRCKKLVTHGESHASAASLLESGEQRYIKAVII